MRAVVSKESSPQHQEREGKAEENAAKWPGAEAGATTEEMEWVSSNPSSFTFSLHRRRSRADRALVSRIMNSELNGGLESAGHQQVQHNPPPPPRNRPIRLKNHSVASESYDNLHRTANPVRINWRSLKARCTCLNFVQARYIVEKPIGHGNVILFADLHQTYRNRIWWKQVACCLFGFS